MAFVLLPLVSAAQFTTVLTDAAGDGDYPTDLDGTEVAYRYDAARDSLWFRVTVSTLTAAQQADVGVNLMFNIPNGGSTFNFWGQDNMNPYHILATVWVTGSAPSSYTGTIGLADATGVGSSNWTNVATNNIGIVVDGSTRQITLGMARQDLVADADLPTSGIDIGFAAAVGSSQFWNDDLTGGTASINITPQSTGIFGRAATAASTVAVFPNPFTSAPQIGLADNATLESIAVYTMQGALVFKGRNVQAVQNVLAHAVPGMYVLEVRQAGQSIPERVRVLKQ